MREIKTRMDYNFSCIIHIVHSTIQRQSFGFGTFVTTRIAKIQNKTEPSQWWCVSKDQNSANRTTRIMSPEDLGTNYVLKMDPDS